MDHFRVRNQDWIDAWSGGIDDATGAAARADGDEEGIALVTESQLSSTIQISEMGDAAVYLLNPAVVTADGEWEAWFFASWAPGATRYPSFWRLMQAEHASFLQLMQDEVDD